MLLDATAPARRLHRSAIDVLDSWPRRGVRLHTSAQVLREYLVVATRPIVVNGLGLSLAEALANAAALLARLTFLEEDRRVHATLVDLLTAVPCIGKQIHDANVVATVLRHGVPCIVTANADDFSRFSDRLEIRELTGGAERRGPVQRRPKA